MLTRIDPLHLLDRPDLCYRYILDASVHSVIQVVIETKGEVSTSSTGIPFGFVVVVVVAALDRLFYVSVHVNLQSYHQSSMDEEEQALPPSKYTTNVRLLHRDLMCHINRVELLMKVSSQPSVR